VPVYEYRCNMCGKTDECYRKLSDFSPNDTLVCACGGGMQKIISAPAVHTFKPFWHEHLDTKPIYIEAKKQLIEECKKRNVTAPAFM